MASAVPAVSIFLLVSANCSTGTNRAFTSGCRSEKSSSASGMPPLNTVYCFATPLTVGPQ